MKVAGGETEEEHQNRSNYDEHGRGGAGVGRVDPAKQCRY